MPVSSRDALIALLAMSVVPLAHARASCGSLKSLEIANTTIDSSTLQPGGPPKLSGIDALALPGTLPERCVVKGSIHPTADSDIKFEVWMPASGWNGKLNESGNGGFAGSINYAGLTASVQRGYVGVSTDTGHSGKDADATWVKGHPEKLVDFGHRAIHLAAVDAKAILKAYYGSPQKRAYFLGCSNGGRQALMSAQRYPEDFDGIIAGAPAYNWTGFTTAFAWNEQAMLRPGAFIPATLAPVIEAAVNQQCDALDGVKDGVVAAPRACHFQPEKLLCTAGQSTNCLTQPQVAALRTVYLGAHDSKGNRLAVGFTPGGEGGSVPGLGWEGWIFGLQPGVSTQSAFVWGVMRDMVTGEDNWQISSFDFDRDPQRLLEKIGPVLNATDPNLSRFSSRGGKLILFQGWSDAAVAPLSTLEYYEDVGVRMGEKQRGQFMRLFMVPGMQHCAGGPGPSSFGGLAAPVQPEAAPHDLSAALERWVEKGVAPESVRAIRARDLKKALFNPEYADVERSGLLCAWPRQAKWNGTGDPKDAASYRCVAPDPHSSP
jgi:pimeloyl-ACP methyl ester carboxylesterase